MNKGCGATFYLFSISLNHRKCASWIISSTESMKFIIPALLRKFNADPSYDLRGNFCVRERFQRQNNERPLWNASRMQESEKKKVHPKVMDRVQNRRKKSRVVNLKKLTRSGQKIFIPAYMRGDRGEMAERQRNLSRMRAGICFASLSILRHFFFLFQGRRADSVFFLTPGVYESWLVELWVFVMNFQSNKKRGVVI